MLFAVFDPPEVAPEVADPGHLGDGVEADVALERDVGLVVLFRFELALRHLVAVQRQRESSRQVGLLRCFRELRARLANSVESSSVALRIVRVREISGPPLYRYWPWLMKL